MKVINVQQNTPEWFDTRRGMITGSSIIDVMSTRAATKDEMMKVLDELGIEYDKRMKVGEIERLLPEAKAVELMLMGEKKLGFYQLVADKIAVEPNGEDRMDRGHRLEQEALDIYAAKTGNKVERVGMFVSDFSDKVGNSPDGATKVKGRYVRSQEVKCLSTARHLKVYDEQTIPDEYLAQRTQYFVVNDDLKELDFVFYDERIPEAYECRHFVITVKREDVEKDIRKYRIYEQMLLQGVDEMVERLAF